MRLLTTFLIALILAAPLSAISVKMPKNHIVAGQERSASFIIVNTSPSFKAVEVEVFSREHTIKGKEKRTPTEDFMIIPPQLIIGPEQERVCTIQWMGDPQITTEIPYRIVVEEVPFNKERKDRKTKSDGAVTIRLKFVNSFYVKPRDSRPDIVAQSVSPSGNNMMVVLKNEGNEHLVVGKFNLQLTGDTSQAIDFQPNGGSHNILAGQSLEMLMPWPETVPTGSYQGFFNR